MLVNFGGIMDKRIFVKKRDGYNKEALDLKYNLNIEYNLGIKDGKHIIENLKEYINYKEEQ